jgi:prepilin-type processing-associated H-X9-DG protein
MFPKEIYPWPWAYGQTWDWNHTWRSYLDQFYLSHLKSSDMRDNKRELKRSSVLVCPCVPVQDILADGTYGLNCHLISGEWWMKNFPVGKFLQQNPSALVFFADAGNDPISDYYFTGNPNQSVNFRHKGNAWTNLTMADGHVISWSVAASSGYLSGNPNAVNSRWKALWFPQD